MVVEAKVRLLATRLRCPLCLGPLDEPPADGAATAPAPCPGCATAYHAACVAELGVACTTLGCALGPKPPPKRGLAIPVDVRPRAGLVMPLALTWLFYVPWPLGLIAWGWALWRARRRRGRAAWAAAVLLSPFVVVPAWSAGAAVHGYATGTAVLSPPGWGAPTLRTTLSLDPEVRCLVRHSGLVLGPDLPEAANELVLRGLTRLFGPMAHAYTGPIPTPAQARVLLERAPATPVATPLPSPYSDDGALLQVTLDGRTELLRVPGELHWRAIPHEAATGPSLVRAAALDGGGLLVAVEPPPDSRRSPQPWALLCDRAQGRAVALVWLLADPLDR